MSLDYGATIAELEAQRAKLDAAIAALRALAANGARPVAVGAVLAIGAAVPAPRRRGGPSLTDQCACVGAAQWEEALALWNQGAPVADLAIRLGTSDAAVFYYAQEHGWPKRRRAAAAVVAAQAQRADRARAVLEGAAPAAVQPKTLEPPRRCPHCAGISRTDPCAYCGQEFGS